MLLYPLSKTKHKLISDRKLSSKEHLPDYDRLHVNNISRKKTYVHPEPIMISACTFLKILFLKEQRN